MCVRRTAALTELLFGPAAGYGELGARLLARSGSREAADQANQRAIALESDPAVREFLQRRDLL